MAQEPPFAFDHKELATALIKQQGIHEGRWAVGFQFNFAAMNIGTADAEKPAALVQVDKVLLIPFSENLPKWMAVDASIVNPVEADPPAS
jgi:hypothetical protein